MTMLDTLAMVRVFGPVSINEIAFRLDVSTRIVGQDLSALHASNDVEFIRGEGWDVTPSGRACFSEWIKARKAKRKSGPIPSWSRPHDGRRLA